MIIALKLKIVPVYEGINLQWKGLGFSQECPVGSGGEGWYWVSPFEKAVGSAMSCRVGGMDSQ